MKKTRRRKETTNTVNETLHLLNVAAKSWIDEYINRYDQDKQQE